MSSPRYFTLEIITPDQLVYSGDVIQVIAPGSNGRFGILVNHTPALFMLTVGQVEVAAIGENRLFTVSGGFAEVRNNVMKIIAEAAEDVQSLDVERARRALQRAQLRISETMPKLDMVRAKASLARATNRIHAAEKMGRA